MSKEVERILHLIDDAIGEGDEDKVRELERQAMSETTKRPEDPGVDVQEFPDASS